MNDPIISIKRVKDDIVIEAKEGTLTVPRATFMAILYNIKSIVAAEIDDAEGDSVDIGHHEAK